MVQERGITGAHRIVDHVVEPAGNSLVLRSRIGLRRHGRVYHNGPDERGDAQENKEHSAKEQDHPPWRPFGVPTRGRDRGGPRIGPPEWPQSWWCVIRGTN